MQQHDKDTMGSHDPSSEHVRPLPPVLRLDVRTQSYVVLELLAGLQSTVSVSIADESSMAESVAVRDAGL